MVCSDNLAKEGCGGAFALQPILRTSQKKSLRTVQVLGLLCLLSLLLQPGLWAQSMGGGLMYSSYLPFTSLYNDFKTKNKTTDTKTEHSSFQFPKDAVLHYAPGGALTSVFAVKGWLYSFDLGLMLGPGPDNIIPNFPVRPFIGANVAVKFVKTPVIGVYGIFGLYFDFALGKGKSSYDFFHMLLYLRGGTGFSFKFGPKVELFAQVQFGIGLQVEAITLESKAGNNIYDGTFIMVPIALFPELGVRFWF